MRIHGRDNNERRGAFVLLTVLVVVAFLALAAYRYNDLMTAEYLATAGSHRAAQARVLAESGIYVAMRNLSAGEAIPDGPREVSLDPQSGALTGSYEIVMFDEESSRWSLNGLMDQDSKGDALRKVLEKAQSYVPELNTTVISAIIDWLDEDDELSEEGAENAYYMALETPYRCKNGPLDSLDELLMVRGVTQEMLDGSGTATGLRALFTANGRQVNYDPRDTEIIHLNSLDLATLETKLDSAFNNKLLTQFILAYRLYGGTSSSSSRGGSGGGAAPNIAAIAGALDPSAMDKIQEQISKDKQPNFFRRLKRVNSIFDLAGSGVTVSYQDGRNKKSVTVPSPLSDPSVANDLLPQLFALLSTAPDPESSEQIEQPARLNVNTAPPAVLALIPDLEEADIQQILGNQPAEDDASGASPAWLFTKAQIAPSKLAKVEKYLTTRPTAVRVQVAARVKGAKSAALMEGTIDLGGPRPRLTSLRDLSDQASTLLPQAP